MACARATRLGFKLTGWYKLDVSAQAACRAEYRCLVTGGLHPLKSQQRPHATRTTAAETAEVPVDELLDISGHRRQRSQQHGSTPETTTKHRPSKEKNIIHRATTTSTTSFKHARNNTNGDMLSPHPRTARLAAAPSTPLEPKPPNPALRATVAAAGAAGKELVLPPTTQETAMAKGGTTHQKGGKATTREARQTTVVRAYADLREK